MTVFTEVVGVWFLGFVLCKRTRNFGLLLECHWDFLGGQCVALQLQSGSCKVALITEVSLNAIGMLSGQRVRKEAWVWLALFSIQYSLPKVKISAVLLINWICNKENKFYAFSNKVNIAIQEYFDVNIIIYKGCLTY